MQAYLSTTASVSSRHTLSSIDNLSSIISDNDLQRVPPSFRNIPHTPSYGTTHLTTSLSSSSSSPLSLTHSLGAGPLLHSRPTHPQPQVVHTTGRSNSMPSWRGYLPMRLEPMTIDQYHISPHFSQKVFLGGISPELTEGTVLSSAAPPYLCVCSSSSRAAAGAAKVRQVQHQVAEERWTQPQYARFVTASLYARRLLPRTCRCRVLSRGVSRVALGVRAAQALHPTTTLHRGLLSAHPHVAHLVDDGDGSDVQRRVSARQPPQTGMRALLSLPKR